MLKRYSVRAILADPVKRRDLMVRCIMSAQHMEGIDTTREQAEAAYDRVQQEKRRRPVEGKAATASKSALKGSPDKRHDPGRG